ncbi:L-alanine-DL-glutamate epimerase [Vibrio xiamenensis]|uniref:L-alanine-DL-glutamate epimerase n=1 Tax=Vibrio xiamenensis TaxID=861298 RepID=A0A1G8H944_9VIBR|nr:enolase C-terminal domain-like protein [Vibrio xiamenensis]SDI03133.1 L-alanine-DL-glutamate epimerase [Vibrio xiamenensis]
MFRYDFDEKLSFRKAVYYEFDPITLPRVFQDGTGGLGKYAPERGCIELYDSEGFVAHYLAIDQTFIDTVLPLILTGETRSFNQWREFLYWKVRNSGSQSEKAVCLGKMDTLMLDLLAQRKNMPLHRFLGATKDWAKAYKGGGSILLDDAELVDDMQRYVSEGYTTVKFKVGSDEMERDLRRIDKVRTALGPEIEIAVDANQKWDVETAAKFAELTEPYQLAWLEEPIHANDMNGIRRLKEYGFKVPLAFGESMRISYEFEMYAEKGVDVLQPSVGRMTRIDDLIAIRDLARDKGLRFMSGGRVYLCALFGTLLDDNELIEFHEPISQPVSEYALNIPTERNGRFYLPSDMPGNPQRLNLEKLEKDRLLKSKRYFYANQ